MQCVDDQINFAVVEEVAESSSSAGDGHRQSRSLHRGNYLKPAAAEVGEGQGTLRKRRFPVTLVDGGVDMTVYGEKRMLECNRAIPVIKLRLASRNRVAVAERVASC
jgi:hypothetical protein